MPFPAVNSRTYPRGSLVAATANDVGCLGALLLLPAGAGVVLAFVAAGPLLAGEVDPGNPSVRGALQMVWVGACALIAVAVLVHRRLDAMKLRLETLLMTSIADIHSRTRP